jgi:outer membrane immunogenic protein
VRKSCLVLSLLAAAALGITAAHADERRPFNGLFFGLHGGYSWQDAQGVFDNIDNPTNLTGLNLNGGIIGAQLSYNVQTGWFLFGVEGDATAHLEDNTVVSPTGIQLSSDSGYLASVRGRLGVVLNNWLLFGSAGVGFADTSFNEITPNQTFVGKINRRETGLVYGGGVEWAFIEGVTLRGEYLHYDVGGTAAIPTSFVGADPGDYVRFSDVDVARAALNISLNP